MILLTPHFSMAEMTTTKHVHLQDVPTQIVADRMKALCMQLEAWRVVSGPLLVTSGYRSVAVNAAVGGARKSQHLVGEAADVIPVRGRMRAWLELLDLVRGQGLPIDQAIIYEGAPHIHVSHTTRRKNRGEFLVDLVGSDLYPSWDSYDGPLKRAGVS